MEFWFIHGNEKYQLPAPPSEFTLTSSNDNQTVNVYKTGDLALWGPKTLDTITISSFFPNPKTGRKYKCAYGDPWDVVKMINRWRDSGKTTKLLITDTNINMECIIDKFDYGVDNGINDVNFSITFSQYRKVTIPKVTENNNVIVNQNTSTKPAPTPSKPSTNGSTRTHTVGANDTLWGIAKKYYGNGSKWTVIWEANKPMRSGNPNIIYKGEVVKIP